MAFYNKFGMRYKLVKKKGILGQLLYFCLFNN